MVDGNSYWCLAVVYNCRSFITNYHEGVAGKLTILTGDIFQVYLASLRGALAVVIDVTMV